MVYVLLEQDHPEIVVRRRSSGWEAESLTGGDTILELPEIGVSIPLAFIYDVS